MKKKLNKTNKNNSPPENKDLPNKRGRPRAEKSALDYLFIESAKELEKLNRESGNIAEQVIKDEDITENKKPKKQKKEKKTRNINAFKDFSEDLFVLVKRDDIKIYYCPEKTCEKTFPTLSRAKRHFLSHTEDKPFKCENINCDKYFSRKDNMLSHVDKYCPFTTIEDKKKRQKK